MLAVKSTTIKYRGIITDRCKTLPKRMTKFYTTYYEAYKAAERLAKRTYGERANIRTEEVKKPI